jgi:hypothetical protein
VPINLTVVLSCNLVIHGCVFLSNAC